ncbi:HupE/UreJ family protein [Mangrovibacterium lignilyticum]|uniref:HupE/UreJ family protein n=1 Tax=Mangrovibacterium lignilyticum TaxID=2668052 RepID=UPI0013D70821|nr:HupE/UreJ family protein [Mangrovibacterium lignilyticum]
MSTFQLYLKLGFEHIINLNGYDHIVFVLALCAGYQFGEVKRLLILITAFTIGHSVTLALSTLNYVLISPGLIEFLIPVTILITALSNLRQPSDRQRYLIYIVVLFFGLIHGLGFSNYLKELLGTEVSIVGPLLAFNLGLEFGQLLILLVYFMVFALSTLLFSMEHLRWKIFISGAAAGIALTIILQHEYIAL